jgi:hypothetical protein
MRWAIVFFLLYSSINSLAQVGTEPIDSVKEILIDSMPQPTIEFDVDSYDLGSIPSDTIIQRTFAFKNSGTDTLELISTTADCSCTVPSFTPGKFLPGETGFIKVSFSGKDNIGRFIQYITVLHNASEGYTFLTLKGFVEEKL